jgi:hypothetical protein
MLNMDRLRGLMEKISKFKEDRRHMDPASRANAWADNPRLSARTCVSAQV